MAAPTPAVDVINWDGSKGSIRFLALWTAGAPDNFTDQQLVDISGDLADAPASIKVTAVDAFVSGNLDIQLEFDATTDQIIDRFINQADESWQVQRDYSELLPNDGVLPSNTGAAGFTGDLLLTTLGAADGDELSLIVSFKKSS